MHNVRTGLFKKVDCFHAKRTPMIYVNNKDKFKFSGGIQNDYYSHLKNSNINLTKITGILGIVKEKTLWCVLSL